MKPPTPPTPYRRQSTCGSSHSEIFHISPLQQWPEVETYYRFSMQFNKNWIKWFDGVSVIVGGKRARVLTISPLFSLSSSSSSLRPSLHQVCYLSLGIVFRTEMSRGWKTLQILTIATTKLRRKNRNLVFALPWNESAFESLKLCHTLLSRSRWFPSLKQYIYNNHFL